jgi:hypothetical protein
VSWRWHVPLAETRSTGLLAIERLGIDLLDRHDIVSLDVSVNELLEVREKGCV